MANLRLPGPTPVPPEVYQAMSKQMIDHRGVEFADMIARLTANLQRAFQTKNDLYVLSSSGTGAMEAAVVNTLSPGQRVLGVTIGNFGDRFLKIASTYGADVKQLKFPDGDVADPNEIRQALEGGPEYHGGPRHPQRDRPPASRTTWRPLRASSRASSTSYCSSTQSRPWARSGSLSTSGTWTWWSPVRRRGGCARRGSP